MVSLKLTMAALLLSVSPAVQAQDAPPQPASESTPTTPQEADPEKPEIVVEGEKRKRICETRTDTGSIMPRRVCRTPEQVAADEERAAFIKNQLSRDAQTAAFTSENNRQGK